MAEEEKQVKCWFKFYEKKPDGSIVEKDFDCPYSADMIVHFIEQHAQWSPDIIFVKDKDHILLSEKVQIKQIYASFARPSL